MIINFLGESSGGRGQNPTCAPNLSSFLTMPGMTDKDIVNVVFPSAQDREKRGELSSAKIMLPTPDAWRNETPIGKTITKDNRTG